MSYGLIIPEIKSREEGAEHLLGSITKFRGKVINLIGNWERWLPKGELQNKGDFEPNACVSFATNSAIETLYNFLKKIEPNYSDRALAIGSGTDPNRGNDPHTVVQYARNKLGFVPEEILPFDDSIKTLEQFYSPKPLTENIIKEGNKFFNEFEINHEWVWPHGLNPQQKKELLKFALQQGPVCVSVYAWQRGAEYYLKPQGLQDNHYVQLVKYNENDCPVIFDSYAETDGTPYLKILDPLYDFGLAKVYYLSPAGPKLSILAKILEVIKKILGIQSQMIDKISIDQPPPPPAPSVEKVSLLEPFCRAIETYENISDKNLNNPGAIKNHRGEFLRFETYEKGFAYLMDYVRRVTKGEHLSYPKGGETSIKEYFEIYAPVNDKNQPHLYSAYVAGKIGRSINDKLKDFI